MKCDNCGRAVINATTEDVEPYHEYAGVVFCLRRRCLDAHSRYKRAVESGEVCL
jgi:hypothetical protein